MATRIRKAPPQEAEVRCEGCGHLEREHGSSGTRPCLAMVGDLMERKFCRCDRFRHKMTKVA